MGSPISLSFCKSGGLRARSKSRLSGTGCTLFAEGIVHEMPLTKENTFVPVLDDIPKKVIKSAKLMFINYPNNPTAAVAPEGFYREVVDFARSTILLSFQTMVLDIADHGYSAPSFLETKGAMEVGIEMHSLSKTYNMTVGGLVWLSAMQISLPALGG